MTFWVTLCCGLHTYGNVYNLPASYVIHTVGPIGRDQKALISCYDTCLELVVQHNISTIALCGISTGIYGYPLYAASHVALDSIRKWLENEENRNKVDLIVVCTYLDKELLCYEKLMPMYFPPANRSTDEIIDMYKQAYDKYDPTLDVELDKEIEKEKVERKKEKEERSKREQELREKFGKIRLGGDENVNK